MALAYISCNTDKKLLAICQH